VAQAIQDFDLNVDAHALALEKIAATDRYQNRCAFPLMPGVRAILDWCRAQRLRAAVVTGANRISLEATFAAHQLKDYFESSVCFEDVRHSKPAADSYLQALNLLGLEAHHCIALEDTQTGVRSAVAAGIEVIAIRNAWTQTQDFSQASFICDSLDGAQEYLASRVGTGVALGRYEYLDR
jgi:HAD superfamily hydrolase (TIGR01509 family)